VKHFYAWYRREGGTRSYSWVKNRLQGAGLVTKAAKRGAHRKRRDRSPWVGMMFHQDGSRHEGGAGQTLLNHWIAGSWQVLELVGVCGKRRLTPAVVDPAPGGTITLSERQGRLLEALVRRSTALQRLVRRAQIILMLAAGKTFNQVARALGVLRHTVYKWCKRWRTQARQLAEVEVQERSDHALSNRLAGLLLDAYRPGKPATFSPEQIVKLIAVACEPPQHSGRPVTRWSSRELAAEVIKRGIVKTIARSTVLI
jgi:putative transposase